MSDVNISKFRAQVIRTGSTPASPGFAVAEGQNPVDPSGSGQNHLPVTIGSPANGLAVTDAQVLTIDKAQIFAGTSAQFVKGDGTLDSTAYGTGSVTSVALTMPTAFSVAGSPITTAGTLAVTATGTTAQYIRGDGSLATFPGLTGFVPYTGATADVNLGTHDLAAERGTFANNGSSDTLTVNHTSGSGYGIIVTKGGANEALYVSKTSGSGNAMTVVGGRTSLVDLALSSVTNTAGDFLTLSGGVVHKRTAAEVRTDIGAGTVTSVGLSSATSGVTIGSTPVTTSGTITLAIATASGSQNGLLSSTDWTTFNGKQNALTLTTTGTSGAATLVGSTLNIPQYQAAGTYVTAVTASSPLASSGGTTPNITIQQASGSQNGFLSSTDWTIFNNKQNALTNPVTGTGTTNYLPKFTGSTTIGNSLFTDNGTNGAFGGTNYYSGTDLRTFNISAPLYAGLSFWANNQSVGNIVGFGATGNLSLNADQSNLFSNTKIILSIDDVERFAVFSNGNVTIANSPTDAGFKLNINSATTGLNVGNQTNSVKALSTFSKTLTTGFGTANNYLQIGAGENGLNGTRLIGFGYSITGNTNQPAYIGYIETSNSGETNGALIFGTRGVTTDTAPTERMRITSGGNVGIGTVSPAAERKLTVAGGAQFTFASNSGASFNIIPAANGQDGVDFNLSYYTGSAYGPINFIVGEQNRFKINPSGAVQVLSAGQLQVFRSDNARSGLFYCNNSAAIVEASTDPLRMSTPDRLEFYAGSTEKMRISSAGVVTITNLGTGTVTSTAGVLSAVSDLSLKVDDGFIDSAIEKVLSLKPRYFYWNEKSGLPTDIRQLGFYAQEVNEAIGEEAANTPRDKNIPWGITDRSIIAMLTKAIQELKQEIDTLKN